MRWIIVVIFSLLLLTGCGNPKKPPPVRPPPVPWSLIVEAGISYEIVNSIVSVVINRFDRIWHPVDIPVRLISNWGQDDGWRYCGTVWTVGCNPEPDLIEFSPHYVVWVVSHDLFHVFAEKLKNPFHNNPYPRDPFHEDPRWVEWNRWRDQLITEMGVSAPSTSATTNHNSSQITSACTGDRILQPAAH